MLGASVEVTITAASVLVPEAPTSSLQFGAGANVPVHVLVKSFICVSAVPPLSVEITYVCGLADVVNWYQTVLLAALAQQPVAPSVPAVVVAPTFVPEVQGALTVKGIAAEQRLFAGCANALFIPKKEKSKNAKIEKRGVEFFIIFIFIYLTYIYANHVFNNSSLIY